MPRLAAILCLAWAVAGCQLLIDGDSYVGEGPGTGDGDAGMGGDGGPTDGGTGNLCDGVSCDANARCNPTTGLCETLETCGGPGDCGDREVCSGGLCVPCDADRDFFIADDPACDGLTEFPDEPRDCDDQNDAVFPGAMPICGNGVLESCSDPIRDRFLEFLSGAEEAGPIYPTALVEGERFVPGVPPTLSVAAAPAGGANPRAGQVSYRVFDGELEVPVVAPFDFEGVTDPGVQRVHDLPGGEDYFDVFGAVVGRVEGRAILGAIGNTTDLGTRLTFWDMSGATPEVLDTQDPGSPGAAPELAIGRDAIGGGPQVFWRGPAASTDGGEALYRTSRAGTQQLSSPAVGPGWMVSAGGIVAMPSQEIPSEALVWDGRMTDWVPVPLGGEAHDRAALVAFPESLESTRYYLITPVGTETAVVEVKCQREGTAHTCFPPEEPRTEFFPSGRMLAGLGLRERGFIVGAEPSPEGGEEVSMRFLGPGGEFAGTGMPFTIALLSSFDTALDDMEVRDVALSGFETPAGDLNVFVVAAVSRPTDPERFDVWLTGVRACATQ